MCTHCVYKKTDDVLLFKSGYLWAMTKISTFYLLQFLNSPKENVQRKYQIWKLSEWSPLKPPSRAKHISHYTETTSVNAQDSLAS